MRARLAAIAIIGAAGASAAAEIAPLAVSFTDGAVAESLTGVPGDPAEGRKAVFNRGLGNCLACHMNSEMEEQPFHGEIGPPLDGVADRWTVEELRGIIVNAKMTFEGSAMPAFYRDASEAVRIGKKYEGQTILTAQQVEDVVAYLATLKE